MATSDTTTGPSLLYRLVNDKELRSVAIQVITIALLFAFLFYIVNNAIVNLNAIGKDYDFKFLSEASNYDINQHLIAYTSRSSHLTAMWVGILNTLLVAISGIVLSTIVGFIIRRFTPVAKLADQQDSICLRRICSQRTGITPYSAGTRYRG